MKFTRFEWVLLLRIALLLAVMTGIAFLIVKPYYTGAVMGGLFLLFLVYDLFKYTNKSNDELQQFIESVHYRDFSRRFDEKHAPASLQPMRKGFNEINSTFKTISKRKKRSTFTCKIFWNW